MAVIFDMWLENPILVGMSLIVLIWVNFHLLKRSYNLWKLNYAHHYKQSFYISNPSQREIIEDNKSVSLGLWITWIIQVVLVTIFSMFCNSPVFNLQISLVSEAIVGFLIGRYIISITGLLVNIYNFRFVINNPQSIKGEVAFSDHFLYTSLRHSAFFKSLFWFLIFLCVERVFFLGFCLNSILNIILSYKWENETIKETASI